MDLFNVFPLSVLLSVDNLQFLLILIIELFVPELVFIDLELKTKPVRNFKIILAVFIKPIVSIEIK